jgi:hypothetical protein
MRAPAAWGRVARKPQMDYQQIFGVIVRTFGLWSIVLGLSSAFTMVRVYGGLGKMNYYDWQTEGLFVVMYVLGGVFLLRRADLVIAFTYPLKESTQPEETNPPEESTTESD